MPAHLGSSGGVGTARQQLNALLVAQLSQFAAGVTLPLIEPPARRAQHACMTTWGSLGSGELDQGEASRDCLDVLPLELSRQFACQQAMVDGARQRRTKRCRIRKPVDEEITPRNPATHGSGPTHASQSGTSRQSGFLTRS